MATWRLKDWFASFAELFAAERTEILSSQILPEGATVVLHRTAAGELDRLGEEARREADRHLGHISRNPALNDGPASHHKAPVVHRYLGDFLYCYIWGMSRGLLEKFDDRLRPPERESLRTGKDFGIVLLRVITLPAASALAEALALRQVPEECAEPLRLRFLEHRDPDEIGVELRLTPLTVRRMLVRGLESWADRLPAADPEPVPLDSWRLE